MSVRSFFMNGPWQVKFRNVPIDIWKFIHKFEVMLRRLGIWWRALADLLLPRVCLVCGRKLGLHEAHMCLYCLADMPLTHFWERSHNPMADKVNGLIQDALCLKAEGTSGFSHHEPYAYASALFFFKNEEEYRHILYSIKYEGNTSAGEHFGKMLGQKLAGAEHFADVDIVIPVPLHWTRKWSRGYNQAECIARTLAMEIGAEMRTDILSRRRRTTTQTKLDVDQKKRNVHGAFEAAAHDIVPVHILLVDDVFTTGSTLFACYRALRETLPQSVRISFAALGVVGSV